jgi:hypothetical protein
MDASKLVWKQWQKPGQAVMQWIAWSSARSVLGPCVLGIIVSGSAVLQRIAEGLAEHGLSQAKMPSVERRLARFIANRRIVVSEGWKQFLEQVLPYWQGNGTGSGKLFDQLQPHLSSCDCTPIADRGLSGMPLVQLCEAQQWH